ncbi:MAG: hypothetical protein IJ179_04505 [Oscillospiraceae bacterium]|nr:hypothetical protein [Oscillospiraceae bacterium]
MNHKKTPYHALALVLCIALCAAPLLSACGQTAENNSTAAAASTAPVSTPTPTAKPMDRRPVDPEYDKEETVYGKADASGKVRSVTVETVLNYAGKDGVVEDLSRLREIKNTEGDEEFTLENNGVLLWEDHGERIRYEGKSGQDLPVSVSISYYLDGQPIKPEKLAGQSGHLRMRFDYQNLSATSVSNVRSGEPAAVETCVPFLAMSIVLLSEDVFSNPEATNGRLLSLGDQSVFVGYAFPGIPDYLKLQNYQLTKEMDIPQYAELEADVQDFTMDFTATVFTNSVFTEVESEDLDDLDSFAYSLNAFTDALPDLANGADALADGSKQLQSALTQYTGGVKNINDGAQALSSALSGMNAELSNARAGANEIIRSLSSDTAPQLDSVASALDQLIAALDGFTGQLNSISGYPGQVSEQVGSAADQARAQLDILSADLLETIQTSALTDEEKAALWETVNSRVDAAKGSVSIDTAVPDGSGFSGSIGSLSASASNLRAQAEALRSSPEQLQQAESMLGQIVGLCDGVNALAQSASALASGTATLNGSSAALNEALAGIAAGNKTLAEGIGQFTDAALTNLDGLGGWQLRTLVTQFRAMRLADQSYDNFGGVAPGRSSTVRFIVETDPIEK